MSEPWYGVMLGYIVPKIGSLIRAMASYDYETNEYTSPVMGCTAAWAEDGEETTTSFVLCCGCRISGRDIKFRVTVEEVEE